MQIYRPFIETELYAHPKFRVRTHSKRQRKGSLTKKKRDRPTSTKTEQACYDLHPATVADKYKYKGFVTKT